LGLVVGNARFVDKVQGLNQGVLLNFVLYQLFKPGKGKLKEL
jgi:hypothetical protein